MARTISGTYTTTQVLSNPATDNPATVTSTGVIDVNSATASPGIFGNSGFAWTLTNLGTVESIGQGIGVNLQSGGLVTNGANGSTASYIRGTGGGSSINANPGTGVHYRTNPRARAA